MISKSVPLNHHHLLVKSLEITMKNTTAIIPSGLPLPHHPLQQLQCISPARGSDGGATSHGALERGGKCHPFGKWLFFTTYLW